MYQTKMTGIAEDERLENEDEDSEELTADSYQDTVV